MLTLLSTISIILAVVYVLVLAVTLIAVAYWLTRAARDAEKLAGGLEAVDGNTAKLPEYLTTINGALVQLRGGLFSVDGHLAAIARAAGLE
jgi:hypothetical protein